MRKLWLTFILLLSWGATAYAQNPNPPGHSSTTVSHRAYRGGQVHEATTDGVTDGIVFWSNGTSQEIHNGKLGKWFPAKFKVEGETVVGPDSPVPDGPQPDLLPAADAVVIDDYVLVSPQQVTAWGGMTGAINQVHLAVDAMNEAFGHAGINATQNVVGIAQDTVNEVSTLSANLSALVTRYQSGTFNTLRTNTGFDTMALMVTQADLCGQGYIMSATFPLVVVNGNCATSNMSYAHEHGHTMGLCHNFGDTSCTPVSVCGPTGVGYGTGAFRTPMSYTGGPRTRQWSAPPPAVWYGDGISAVGIAGQTDATRCIKLTMATVAGWHATAGPPPPPTHTAATALAWVSGTLTWTHTRPADLTNYTLVRDGNPAANIGLPATNSYPVALAPGGHSLILNACYVDATCLASNTLSVTVPSSNTPISYTNLLPADNSTVALGGSATMSVSATDDSGILSVTGMYSTGGTFAARTTTLSGTTYSWKENYKRKGKGASASVGVKQWYFVIKSVDGETVFTPTRRFTVQ